MEVLQANLQDFNSCTNILRGASTVYHINPNHPKESEIGINMVSAAVEEKRQPDNKFEHFILSSVLCSQLSKMLNHARKLKVEEYLLESAGPATGALNWTIIQPGHLAEALIGRLVTAMNKNPGQSKVPFEGQFDAKIPFSFLSLLDLAQASARIIEQRQKHYFATYGLASTFPMPYQDFIKQVGTRLNVQFQINVLPHDEAVDANCISAFGTTDIDQATRDGPERLVLFYNKRGLLGNPNVCSWLLGRDSTSIDEMVNSLLREQESE